MAIPTRQEMRLPLLQHFADGEEHHWETVKESLANHFALTASDKQLLNRFGSNLFGSKLYTVLNHLGSEGMVELAREQIYYRITDRGRSVLRQPPETINSAFWKQFKLPSVDVIIPVILDCLGDRETRYYPLIRSFLTDHFSITKAQRKAISSSWGLKWNRHCWGACRALLHVDFVESAYRFRGHYRITDLGFEVLQDPPEVLDTTFLKSFRYPDGEIDRLSLQYVADKGPKPRERFIEDLVSRLRTDTYSSGENLWIKNCNRTMSRLEKADMITSTGEGSDVQITAVGRAALVLEPEKFPFGFISRFRKQAVALL